MDSFDGISADINNLLYDIRKSKLNMSDLIHFLENLEKQIVDAELDYEIKMEEADNRGYENGYDHARWRYSSCECECNCID